MQIDPAVFLQLFASTKASAADTMLSLAAAGHLSRDVTFHEIDQILAPVSPTWSWRTHKYTLQVRLFTKARHRGRLSIHRMNANEYDHSQCPRCMHKGPLYGTLRCGACCTPVCLPSTEEPSVCTVHVRQLFTAWELRLMLPAWRVPAANKLNCTPPS